MSKDGFDWMKKRFGITTLSDERLSEVAIMKKTTDGG
jgi:hypothetical protein